MRIMYLTQWFEPEPNIIKGIGFVRALEAAGHEVTVVTGFPNYPTGRLYPGYGLRLIHRETIGGVRVVRLPLYPSHDSSSLRRSLNFLSFFLSALLYCLFRRQRFDLAYVYHPPITVGLAAALTSRVRRLPFLLDIQDLWPDTVAETGMSGARTLVGMLDALCRFVYRRASAIIVQSEGMARTLAERGVPAAKLSTIRNWADAELQGTLPQTPPAPVAGQGCAIVYGGNFGLAQALETVVDAAATVACAANDISIRLYGDGIEADRLRARAAAAERTVLRFEPRQPQDAMLAIFARADALLLHLADSPLFAITIPSKTQVYLAMGRPIIAGVAGETAELLRRSGAALVVPPGDAEAMAGAIRTFAGLPADQRRAMGEAGRRFYHETFSFERALLRTLAVIHGTHGQE